MVLVAVAGGSSPSLGKSIVQHILATGKHEVIILSRAKAGSDSNTSAKQSKYGASIRFADYDSIDSLTTALKGVHTLISVLKIPDPGAMIDIHTKLLEACKAAKVTRFTMSDWAMSVPSHKKVDMLAHKDTLLELCEQANNDPNSDVNCSTVQVGMFMNYFAQGSPRINTDSDGRPENSDANNELTGGLIDDFMLTYIDISKGVLQIPVTAEGTPLATTVTHLLDVGALVAASLELPPDKMRGALGVASQQVTFEEVRAILESKCGVSIKSQTLTRAQCDAVIDELGSRSSQAMAKGGFDLEAFMGHMVAQMMGVMCDTEDGKGASVVEPNLNRLLENNGIGVKTRTVEELLVRAWEK